MKIILNVNLSLFHIQHTLTQLTHSHKSHTHTSIIFPSVCIISVGPCTYNIIVFNINTRIQSVLYLYQCLNETKYNVY